MKKLKMYQKINALLESYFGIRMTKVIQPKEIPKNIKTASNNLIIEFIGPSGVGKSTLYNYFLRNHKTNFKQSILTRTDLKSYTAGAVFDIEGIHEDLFKEKIKSISNSTSNGSLKHKTINYSYEMIANDYLATKILQNKIIISDEHLFSLLGNLADLVPDDFFINRIFIGCFSSSEIIFNYINKRKKEGTTMIHHRRLNDLDLKAFIERDLKRRLKSIDLIESKGGKVIKINTADNLTKNCEILDDLISNFINKNKENIN